jgi:hypothetical protein
MFSWTPSDMPGVPREVIKHHLALCPQAHPVKQKTSTREIRHHHSGSREAEAVGVLDTGISWSTCSWAPSTAQLWPKGGTMTEASGEDPHEEAPHEENDG